MPRMPFSKLQLPLLRYGLVGALATGTHVGGALLLAKLFLLPDVWASFGGFGAAVGISYIGHSQWTFAERRLCLTHFLKFVAVAIFTWSLSALMVLGLTPFGGVSSTTRLILSIVCIPLLNYLINKCWTFRPSCTNSH